MIFWSLGKVTSMELEGRPRRTRHAGVDQCLTNLHDFSIYKQFEFKDCNPLVEV